MRRQIERYGRSAAAILLLAAVGIVCAGYILVQQRLRIPFDERYALSVEVEAAAGLTPGLGQPVNVAGVKVGQISDVTLRDGRALVELEIDPEELPQVFADARAELVPRTPLKDLQIELDPGRNRARPLPDGGEIRIDRTTSPIDSDELTGALDADTRQFLLTMLGEGERALADRGPDLRAILKSLEPTAEQLAEITAALRSRRGALRGLVHELSILAKATGARDAELGQLVRAGNTTLGALAAEERALRGSVADLPATLQQASRTLVRVEELTERLRPALNRLRPAARQLPGALNALAPVAREAPGILRTQLRPLVREAQPLVRDALPVAKNLSAVTPDLTTAFLALNYVANELTFNPEGDDEGYLHWLAWFAHNSASFLSTQDANGPAWRGLLLVSCSTLGAAQEGFTTLATAIFGALPACEE